MRPMGKLGKNTGGLDDMSSYKAVGKNRITTS